MRLQGLREELRQNEQLMSGERFDVQRSEREPFRDQERVEEMLQTSVANFCRKLEKILE
jgi:hypothetical protein